MTFTGANRNRVSSRPDTVQIQRKNWLQSTVLCLTIKYACHLSEPLRHHLGMWFSGGLASAGLTDGLDVLKGLFLKDSMIQ